MSHARLGGGQSPVPAVGRALGGRREARPARPVNDTWVAACCQAADVTLGGADALLGTLASRCRVDSIHIARTGAATIRQFLTGGGS
jgi:hypothetical protein